MLYFDFKNYEEFKERFGIIEHGNGVKSRRNKILLALYKDKRNFKERVKAIELVSQRALRDKSYVRLSVIRGHVTRSRRKNLLKVRYMYDMLSLLEGGYSVENLESAFLGCTTLQDLQIRIRNILTNRDFYPPHCSRNLVLSDYMVMWSDKYYTDVMEGICEDGTMNAIRYINSENSRVFKMRAGRMLNHVMSLNRITANLPEEVKRWYSEMFVAEWTEHVRQKNDHSKLKLHVDDNFCDIYSRECCAGYDEDDDSFGSCMVDDEQYHFYENSVPAKAAYLTDPADMIVARCIIYTDVTDENGKKYRLAERQYSMFSEPSLQRQLIAALIREKQIDGFKRVGASCHAPTEFVSITGEPMNKLLLRTPCNLEDDDILSYQDSFKWYNPDKRIAYNYDADGSFECLDQTDRRFQISWCDDHRNEVWSCFHDCYIPEDDAIYIDYRDDYFFRYECDEVRAIDREGYHYMDCFEKDYVSVGEYYYFAGIDCEELEEYGIGLCDECGDYFLLSEGFYSDLTDEFYCCEDCKYEAEKEYHLNRGHVFSDYDDEWFEDSDDVILANEWGHTSFWTISISVDTFNSLVEEGNATMFNGRYYIDRVNLEGEPVHLFQDTEAVA